MHELIVTVSTIAVTLVCYAVAKYFYDKYRFALLLPIFVGTFLIIVLLLLLNVSYDTYMIGGKWINAFLGPAVVSLAYPLYQHRLLLKELAYPILVGSFVGSLIGIVTGVLLGRLARLEETFVYSILPKSVTTPVAMEISESIGGIAPLAVILVIVAGFTGVLSFRFITRLFRITHVVGRGVAIGSASHAIGTAYAFENSHLEGSISTIAMIVSAIFTSILTPIIIVIL